MKVSLIVLALCLLCLALLFAFGPREPVRGPISLDLAAIEEDVDAYLFAREEAVPNLVRGAQKHVRWHDPARRDQTDWAVVYLHGFSATSHEIRPVPELVAGGLEANLFYTRFRGHGRDGPAMAEATVPAWTEDVAEALEIGRRIGRRTVVIGTSTGGTMAALAALDPRLAGKIDAVVFVSPNFRPRAAGSSLLTWPFARWFVPRLVGEERFWTPANAEQGMWWTNRYPMVAVLPMAASVKAAAGLRYEDAGVPALFVFSDADETVDASVTRRVAARWGTAPEIFPVLVGPGDDPSSHVIAGDIMSPGQTRPVAERILRWMDAL